MGESFDDIKNIIRSLLLSSKEDLTIRQLGYDYTEYIGEKIPFLKMGFTSLEKFLQSMPDVLYFTNNDDIMKVCAISTKNNEHIRRMVNAQKNSSIKSNKFSRNISSYVEQEYKNMATKRKNLEIKKVSGSVETVNSRFPKNDSECKTVKDQHESKNALPLIPQNDPIFLIDLPLDVNMEIPPIELPSYFKDGFTFNVNVTAVHNPYRFWFHEVVENNHPLDLLMYQINKYYNQIPNELCMAKHHIHPGICCVIYYKYKWYRAEVLELVETNENVEIKVFCVDYGTFRKCSIFDLRYMRKDFSKLSRQALRGELTGIRRFKIWNLSALSNFINILNSGQKKGTIIGALSDNKICRLNVIVSNEKTGTDDFLKDSLGQSCDHLDQKVEFLDIRLQRAFIDHSNPYDYPPFEVIEKGKSYLFKRIIKELNGENMNEHKRKRLEAQLNKLLINA